MCGCTLERDRRDAADARPARFPVRRGVSGHRSRSSWSGALERSTIGRPSVRRASAGRAGSYGHQQVSSCGLRSALCRSPDETYRLHHNIKASEYRVIGKPESKLSPQANAAGEQAGCGGRAARWAGNAAGRRPAPAKLGGPAMPVRRVVCVRRRRDAMEPAGPHAGLRRSRRSGLATPASVQVGALVGDAARTQVGAGLLQGLRSCRRRRQSGGRPGGFGGSAMLARCAAYRSAGLRCQKSFQMHSRFTTSIFDAPILSFAMRMPRLPVFWALLQKMGPKFDVTPELPGGFSRDYSVPNILTWENACARGCVSPFPLAKPPRSSDGPITIAWLSRLLRCRFCASPRCGRGRVRFVSPGRRPRGFFRPSPSRWPLSPGLAIPCTAISVRIRSSSCCRLRLGSSLDAMVGPSSPSTELAARCLAPSVWARPLRCAPFPNPVPRAASPVRTRRPSSWLLSSEPRPSPDFVRLDRVGRRCIPSECRMRCSA